MFKRVPHAAIVLAWVISSVTCTVPNDEKCVKGYHYDSQYSVCMPDESDTGDAGDDTEDAGIDTDDGSCSEPETFTGINKSCKEESECAGNDADFCLVDPGSGEGGCVLTGCDEYECPCGYSCCDCKSIGFPIFCVPEEIVAEMESYSCQCN